MLRPRNAFTLIEMLVVVAIIAILFGLSLAAYSGVNSRARISATQTTIETMKQALESYSNDFGDYPPSNPKRAGLTGNGSNDGIECLVRCLTTTKKNGPYGESLFQDKQLENIDNDTTTKNGPSSSYSVPTLHELVDAWGQPFIYLHNKDYKKGHFVTLITDKGTERSAVKGAKSEKTGQYQSLTSFQIWSVGPNGKNENGGGDDIASWK